MSVYVSLRYDNAQGKKVYQRNVFFSRSYARKKEMKKYKQEMAERGIEVYNIRGELKEEIDPKFYDRIDYRYIIRSGN
jgi:recombinational DNA repair ATPase RecF